MRKILAVGLVVLVSGLVLVAQEAVTCSVQALFVTPTVDGVIEQALVSLIAQAQHTIDVAMYSFTDDQLGAALIAAHERGVQVRVIIEGGNVHSLGSEVGTLLNAGIPVKKDTASGKFHHKFAIIDGTWVVTGSYNWSESANDDNYENVVILQCPELAAVFTQHFETYLWPFAELIESDGGGIGVGWCPGCSCVEKLNRATVSQYMEVPGIGETLARRIVEYREQIGGFTNPYQLDDVRGIGEVRMNAILQYFCPELFQ